VLASKELEALAKGRWQLDCPEIILSDKKGQVQVAAHGRISNNKPGKLTLTLFVDRRSGDGFVPNSDELLPDLPGLLTLKALDVEGRIWTADLVLVHRTWHTGVSPFWSLTATCEELRANTSLIREDTSWPAELRKNVHYSFFFVNRIEFPVNNVTKQTREVAGTVVSNSNTNNVAIFDACGHSFCMEAQGEVTCLSVSTHADRVPAFFEERIIESLQFVLTQWCEWSVLTWSHGNSEETRIRSIPVFSPYPDKRVMMPPIDISWLNVAPIWDLFAAYLGHIHDWSKKEWHPISQFLRSVLLATYSMPTEAILPLCVAVEGVLNQKLPSAPKPAAGLKDAIGKVLVFAEAGRNSGQLKIGEAQLKLLGKIMHAMIGAPEPEQKAYKRLIHLAGHGIIDAEDVSAWKAIRDPLAHGQGLSKVAENVNSEDSQRVLVLLYKLVFSAIGYKGKYSDWTARAAPLINFVPH